jgi:hypothetical protein
MMNWERWVDPRVASVRVAGLCAYLASHGWVRKPFPRPKVFVYEGPADDEGEPIELWVPASEQFSDFWYQIVRVITTLCVLEDRHAVAVLDDILNQQTNGGDNGANRTDTAGTKPNDRPLPTPSS